METGNLSSDTLQSVLTVAGKERKNKKEKKTALANETQATFCAFQATILFNHFFFSEISTLFSHDGGQRHGASVVPTGPEHLIPCRHNIKEYNIILHNLRSLRPLILVGRPAASLPVHC